MVEEIRRIRNRMRRTVVVIEEFFSFANRSVPSRNRMKWVKFMDT